MLMKKQISDFQANGVVLLKGVLNDFVNDARVAIEENMAQPSWRERTYHKDDGSAPFFQDYVVWNQFEPPPVCWRLQSKYGWSLWKKVTEQTGFRPRFAHARFG